MSVILLDPSKLRVALLAIGVVAALLAYVLHRVRLRGSGEASSSPVILLNLDKPASPAEAKPAAPVVSPAPAPPAAFPAAAPSPGYTIQTLQTRPSLALDLLRVGLVILALVVAAGFILILLPQRSVDTMSRDLQARSGVAPKQDLVALLYLGDELKDKDFHVRGVVRNITTQPIEKLDASIRLYGSGGILLETAIVRMDKESFAPDETAEFHLVYPNYSMQFSSYAVDFKLRQGDLVPYKDMRGSRTQN
jgi:hypothetical protein